MLNKTGIFAGKVMGMEEVPENNVNPEDEYELQQQRVMNENGVLRALQPINFQDKIMGGQNFQNNVEWKLPQISGALNYTQKVNMLTGKGVNKMEQEINTQNKINQILSSNDSHKKVGDLLGNNKKSKMNINNYFSSGKKSDIKIDGFFSSGGKSKMDMNKFFSTGGKSNTKIDTLLGNRDKKKIDMKFDTSFGFGKRAFTGINMNQKINEILSTKSNISKKSNIIQNQKNDALNKINNSFGMNNMFNNNIKKMFGTFENPEKIATRRLKQQKGLPMFGDFDGDKVLNMFDCNPLDPTKQADYHEVLNDYAEKSGFNDVNNTAKENISNMGKRIGQGFSYLKDKLSPSENNIPNESFLGYVPRRKDVTSGGQYIEVGQNNIEEAEKQIKPTTPDTMTAPLNFGTSPYNGPDPGNIGIGDIGADINNDGVIDKKDTEAFSELNINSQLQEMLTLMNKTNDPIQRQKYNQVYKKLLDTKKVFIEESAKSQRAKGELEFKKSKFTTERLDKLAENTNKQYVAGKQIELQKNRFDFEKDLTGRKLDEAVEDKAVNRMFQQEALQYQKQRDAVSDKRQEALMKKNYEIEKTKLAMQAGKNDSMLWESKLRAGANMVGSLLGGSNKPTNMGDKVGLNRPSEGPSLNVNKLIGTGNSNEQKIMMMSGGLQQQKPFSVAAQELVGQPQQKSFAQKVNESINNKAPEEIIEEQRMQQYTPQQNEQVIQQPIPQQAPQQMSQQPIRYQQPQQYPQQRPVSYAQPQQRQNRDLNWNNISPQEAAQYDPEYAKYLAETQGEVINRRGPYKKRRF